MKIAKKITTLVFSITTSSVPKFVQVFWNYFAENAANLNVFQKKRNIFTQKYWKKTNWERVWAKRMQTCPKRSHKAFLTKRLQILVAAHITEMWTFCGYLRRQLPLRQKHNSEFWERIVKFKIPAKTYFEILKGITLLHCHWQLQLLPPDYWLCHLPGLHPQPPEISVMTFCTPSRFWQNSLSLIWDLLESL